MQANTLTLAVDPANNATVVNETYTRYEEQVNRSTYVGAAHLPDDRDMFVFYRTQPTKSGNFKGVAKSAVKFTRDVSIAGVDASTTLTAPIIIDVSFSIPVGTPAADVEHARQRVIALLDKSTEMSLLNQQLMV